MALATRKDTLMLRFPSLQAQGSSAPAPSTPNPAEELELLRRRARSEFPDITHQRRRIDEAVPLEPNSSSGATLRNALSPTVEECAKLSLKEGTSTDFPETWSRRYGDRGSLVDLACSGQPNYTPEDRESHQGSLYIYFEDYHSSGPADSLAAQLYDRYRSTGAYGYLVRSTNNQTDVILAYRADREHNVLALLDNQNRASEQFPHSEPRLTRPIRANELPLIERISGWGELDAERDLLITTRAQWRREQFKNRLHDEVLPKGWSFNILGPRIDGRETLYRRLEFDMGMILPSIQPVTSSFKKGPKAAYPKGSKFLVMRRYRMAALDFLRAMSLYLQDQERRPTSTPNEFAAATIRPLLDLLEKILSARTPPSFQVPIPVDGPYRAALTSVARYYERSASGARLNTRGTFADEMFIFSGDREEFEVVLAERDSAHSLKARGRVVFTEAHN